MRVDRLIRSASLTVLLVGCAATLNAVSDTDENASTLAQHSEVAGAISVIDAWLDATLAYDQVPGISVGIVHDQSLVWSNGYGFANLEAQEPANANTIYSICSISKLFTSIGVMQLRDQKKLRLTDPIEQHLDWFDIQRKHDGSPALTVESLLTHSSGLPRESEFGYWAGPDFPFPTREQMIERLTTQETLYASQERFQYSNLAMTVLGEILETVGGAPYADAIAASILEPLGLDDTRPFYPDELRGQQLAIGYTGFDRRLKREPVSPFFTRAITPAAGFTSTVNDLADFARWQFRLLGEAASADDTSILASNTLREMQRVHWVDPDWSTTWGLGFSVRREGKKSLVGHGGGCPGYITQFLMSPKDKIAVIVLTNAGDGPAGRLANGILKLITPPLLTAAKAQESTAAAEETGEEGVPDSDSQDKDEQVDLSPYIGNYTSRPWGGETAVRKWGNQLILLGLPRNSIDQPTKLEHVEGHTFVRLTEDGEKREKVLFEVGDDGVAQRMVVHGNPSTRIP